MKQVITLKSVRHKCIAPGLRAGSLAVCFLFQSATLAAEDSAIEACEEAVRIFNSDGDINAALEEARWCVEGLEALKQDNALEFFPDQVDSWVAGKATNNKILGVSMVERVYSRDGRSISVSLANGGTGTGLMGLRRSWRQSCVDGDSGAQ